MAEIEITTTGELKVEGNVIGIIAWASALVGPLHAGVYDDQGYGYDEFGDVCECSGCVERQNLLEENESAGDDIRDLVSQAQHLLVEKSWQDDTLDDVIRTIGRKTDDMEFGE